MSQNHSFDNFFEVVLADTLESKEIHYNLRYQVYCDELGYEDKRQFPLQMEIDDWDDRAVHFIVRNKHSGLWLGAMRIVYHNELGFPFEGKCASQQPLTLNDYRDSVEISRLCVVKEARRFAGNNHSSTGIQDISKAEENNSNVRYLHKHHARNRSLMWGLLRAAVVYSAQQGIKQWYFLVTDPLAYCLQKEGFEMQKIGGISNHNGQRSPYMLDVDNFLANPMWLNDYKNDFRPHSELVSEETYARRYA